MKSIRSQLTAYTIALVLLICVAFGVGGYLVSSRALSDEIEQSLVELAETTAMLVSDQLDQLTMTLSVVAARRILSDGTPWDELAASLQEEAERLGYEAIGVVDLQGVNRRSDGAVTEVGDRDYFLRARQGEANISDVLISRATNQPIMVVAVPILRNQRVEGVLIGIRDTDILNTVVDNVGLGDSGYSFIINEQGTLIGHGNRDLVRDQRNFIAEARTDSQYTALANVMLRATQGEVGFGAYNFFGSDRIMGFAPIGTTGWSIMVGSFLDDVMARVYFMRLMFVLIAIGGVILGLLVTFFLSQSIARPIASLTEMVATIAKLDLRFDENDATIKYLKRKDEVGVMIRAVVTLQKSFAETIMTLQDVSKNVAITSENLSASSQQNSATIEEVASSVGSFSQTVNDTKNKAVTMREDSSLIGRLANEGTSQMNSTRKSMDSIVMASGEVKLALEELSTQAKKMDGVLKLISDVADQTNLLALNAAIEAARAGEHGRGFAVVADEVRKLAEQTQQSVGDIAGMINQLIDNASKSTQIMNGAEEQTHNGSALLAKTQDGFGTITTKIKDTVEGIEEITHSIQAMNETSESIAAASQEQAASMEEIASTTETLANMGENLREIVEKFKL